ncbi:MAG: AMP-binding protein [Chloroflexi bacterium]|nr:AMP-binding protein [Chloroflexota bacterium]
MHLFAKFEQTALTHPHKPAFIYFDKNDWKTLTYAQLLDQTHRFLRGLSACPLTPGMSAAVMTPPSAEFFPFALALLKFGIIPIILDPAIGLKKVGQILKESQPDIFIGNTLTHLLRIVFGWGRNSIKHNLSIQSVKSRKSNVNHFILHPSSFIPAPPAAIIYTSGSTGLPKGAIYTHSNLAAQLDLLQNTFGISQDEIDLPAFPLYALIDLLLGVTSVIPDITFPIPAKTDPAKVIRAIQQFSVTNMFASPVVLDILASFWSPAACCWRERAPALQSLKRIITAGAPATIPLQENFRNLLDDHTNLFGIYGATESLPIAKVESREIFSLKEKTESGAGICLGKPIKGVAVRIIRISDAAIQEWQESLSVESNVVGEITVQSAATTRAYVGQIGNLTYKIKLGDDIIHRTGDVGYFDEAGRLWYCGRKSHRVITKEEVLFTEQIENIFNAHPQVKRTALVGVNSEPVLWVELEKHVRANKDKIRQALMALSQHHPQASKIKEFLFMKKFPTDVRHNSKIIREQLAAQANKRISSL